MKGVYIAVLVIAMLGMGLLFQNLLESPQGGCGHDHFHTDDCDHEDSPLIEDQPPPEAAAVEMEEETAVGEVTEKDGVVTTASGLQYQDIRKGSGDSPKRGDMVLVHYTGRLESGAKFDSSHDRGKPFDFRLGVGQVIPGWDEGVATMKVGGKRKLTIPPDLGYGDRPMGDKIPANSTLIFDVELLGIRQ